ncbi:MAG: membrane protein insertase YidC [Alphaproteobacteria bacterium]|nr:membrane protein insertase YidC [Rickettsiales bacterium]
MKIKKKPQINDQKDEQTRLIVFSVLSVIVVTTWSVFFPAKKHEDKSQYIEKTQTDILETTQNTDNDKRQLVKNNSLTDNKVNEQEVNLSLENSLINSKQHRVKIENDSLIGSINLIGANIDDIKLKNYHEDKTGDKKVRILSPRNTKKGYFITTGWVSVSGIAKTDLPNQNTVWKANSKELTPDRPLFLSYSNRNGQDFGIKFSIDSKYMINVEQFLINKSKKSFQVESFSMISRKITNPTKKSESYQGPVGYTEESFKEIPYKKLLAKNFNFKKEQNVWFGLSQKYWLSSIYSSEQASVHLRSKMLSDDYYKIRIIFKKTPVLMVPNASNMSTTKLFVGSKNIKLLERYSKNNNIKLFSRAIDLGRLYFITKPLLLMLGFINKVVNNYGLSIIVITIMVRLALIPLTNKSYHAMAKMKALAPQIADLKKIHSNKKELDLATLELYRKEKVNPLAGFVPLLMQIPIFFALYKALYVSIDLRHSVFIKGWINDLSVPDPTSFANLFGLLPFTPPQFLQIGVLPILMGLTMWLQQKSSSVGTLNKEQMVVIKYMPVLFVFLFSNFPAGLVLYWVVTNTFSIIQEKIMNARKEKRLRVSQSK